MKYYLIVNTGSTSSKYSLYSETKELFFAYFEKQAGKNVVTFCIGDRVHPEKTETEYITDDIFRNSIPYFIDNSIRRGIIEKKDDIAVIGIRVVASGSYFQSDRIVDETFLSNIMSDRDEEPLHVPVTLEEIEQLRKTFSATPIIGISDSAFHKNTPDLSRLYAIPRSVAETCDIYHFGYHGISVGSIVNKLNKQEGPIGRIIVCHLGGGSSVTAVKDGKSFDTSMGYSPLQGLVTATRSGDIDPVAVIHLGKKLQKNTQDLEIYMNTQCGLLGLSNTSSDIRDLLQSEQDGNSDAVFALQKFVVGIKKYIGSYMATMDGVDAIVFSGTIGERSAVIRERILKGLDSMGIILNVEINNQTFAADATISTAESRVKIFVVCTDEMSEIAKRLIAFPIQ